MTVALWMKDTITPQKRHRSANRACGVVNHTALVKRGACQMKRNLTIATEKACLSPYVG
jgi:hypothetical protein